jgi:hypothetical protein
MSSEELAREAQDPLTSADRLQEIAQADHGTWVAIASHPSADRSLLEWLGEHGDDSVRDAIAQRSLTPPAPPVADEDPPTQQLPSQNPADDTLAAPLDLPADGTPPAEGGKKNPLLAVGIVAAIVAVIVGGYFAVDGIASDDDDEGGLEVTKSSKADTSEDSKADTPEDGATGEQEPEDDDAPSGGFCETMKDVQQTTMDALQAQKASGTPDGELFEGLADDYAELEASAPAEIKRDVTVMRRFVDNMVLVSKDPSKAATMKMNGFTGASTIVSQYYVVNCR